MVYETYEIMHKHFQRTGYRTNQSVMYSIAYISARPHHSSVLHRKTELEKHGKNSVIQRDESHTYKWALLTAAKDQYIEIEN